jgi:putative hydrolase of the HAD superfamily
VTAAFDAILFDADGVLQATDEKWFYAMTALIGTDDEEQLGQFFGHIMTAELPSLAGQRPFEGPLGEVLTRWNVTTPAAEVLELWHHVDVDQGVVAAVRELRADGIRCALATNQHPERAAYMRENLGYDEVFDHLFYSCDLRVAKPAPAYFTEAVRRLGTEPGRTLLLDDNHGNVAGAREAGLIAELFTADGGRVELDRILDAYAEPGSRRGSRGRPLAGHGESPPRTRKSSLTLAAVKPWGSWVRYRHARDR